MLAHISSNNDPQHVVNNERPDDLYDLPFNYFDSNFPDPWFLGGLADNTYTPRNTFYPCDHLAAIFDSAAFPLYSQSQISQLPDLSPPSLISHQDTPYEASDHTQSHETKEFEYLFNAQGDGPDLDNFDPFPLFTTTLSPPTNFSAEYYTAPLFEPELADGYVEHQLPVTAQNPQPSQASLLQETPDNDRSISLDSTSPVLPEACPISSIPPPGNQPSVLDGMTFSPPENAQPPPHDSHPAILCHCQWSGCEREFSSGSVLHKHVITHADESHTCRWAACGIRFQSGGLLNKHIQTHTKPFSCPENGCRHSSAKSRDLRRHILSHGLRSGNKVFYCSANQCGYGIQGRETPFKRLDHAKRHIKRKHSGLTMEPIIIQL